MNSLFTDVEISDRNQNDVNTRRIDLNNRYKKMKMPRLNLNSDIHIFYSDRLEKHVYTSNSEIVLSLISDLENHLHETTQVQSFIRRDEDFDSIELMITEANGRLGAFVKLWQHAANEAIRDKTFILDSDIIRKGISILHDSDNLDDEDNFYQVKISQDWKEQLMIFMNGKIRSENLFRLFIQEAKSCGVVVHYDAIFLSQFLKLLNVRINLENTELGFKLVVDEAISLWKNIMQYCTENGEKSLSPRELKLYQRKNNAKKVSKKKKRIKKDRTKVKAQYKEEYHDEEHLISNLINNWLDFMDFFEETILNDKLSHYIIIRLSGEPIPIEKVSDN